MLEVPPPLPPKATSGATDSAADLAGGAAASSLGALPEEDAKRLMCHALSAICSAQGREALFYDSKSSDASVREHPYGVADGVASLPSLGSAEVDHVEMVLDEDLGGVWAEGDPDAVVANGRSISTILANADERRRLEAAFTRHCAAAYSVDASQIHDLSVRAGSIKVSFQARGWDHQARSRVERGTAYLYGVLKGFRSVTVHPLFKQCAFDLSLFDAKGNKTFGEADGMNFEVGSPAETYYQPTHGQGWRRFGLKVTGKYADGDEWLHPFNSNPKLLVARIPRDELPRTQGHRPVFRRRRRLRQGPQGRGP